MKCSGSMPQYSWQYWGWHTQNHPLTNKLTKILIWNSHHSGNPRELWSNSQHLGKYHLPHHHPPVKKSLHLMLVLKASGKSIKEVNKKRREHQPFWGKSPTKASEGEAASDGRGCQKDIRQISLWNSSPKRNKDISKIHLSTHWEGLILSSCEGDHSTPHSVLTGPVVPYRYPGCIVG